MTEYIALTSRGEPGVRCTTRAEAERYAAKFRGRVIDTSITPAPALALTSALAEGEGDS